MQTDINDICGDVLNNAKFCGSFHKRMEAIMRHFSKVGLTVATVADSRHMDRAESTIKRYCRLYGVTLADYTPMSMREPKP